MGFYSDCLALAETAYKERLAGGQVDSYSVQGVDVSLCPMDKLWVIVQDLKKSAADEAMKAAGGSRFHFVDMRPRR